MDFHFLSNQTKYDPTDNIHSILEPKRNLQNSQQDRTSRSNINTDRKSVSLVYTWWQQLRKNLARKWSAKYSTKAPARNLYKPPERKTPLPPSRGGWGVIKDIHENPLNMVLRGLSGSHWAPIPPHLRDGQVFFSSPVSPAALFLRTFVMDSRNFSPKNDAFCRQ